MTPGQSRLSRRAACCTIAPVSSGGSLVRADAQVIWFPPRTAAEYDPARYQRARDHRHDPQPALAHG